MAAQKAVQCKFYCFARYYTQWQYGWQYKRQYNASYTALQCASNSIVEYIPPPLKQVQFFVITQAAKYQTIAAALIPLLVHYILSPWGSTPYTPYTGAAISSSMLVITSYVHA
jgi:hypothetical protein